MAEEWAIEASGLEKSYGPVTVLDGVDLRVRRGTVFALLGPNGAGKTTLVRILSTLVRPDAGGARVAGFDIAVDRQRVRRCISLTGQDVAVDGLQTGAENLRMMARLAGLSRPQARRRTGDLLAQFGLASAAQRRVANYSGGMRRRLDLAAGLVGSPAVIFLDEPTTGLDLPSRQAMWQVITDLVRTGATVFLTTQYLQEADQLADQIAVVNAGAVVAQGSPADLKSQIAEQRLELTLTDGLAFEDVTRALGARVVSTDPSRMSVGVATDGSAVHVRGVLDEVDPGGRAVRTFAVHAPTLDDVFLALTGHATTTSTNTTNTESEPAHV